MNPSTQPLQQQQAEHRILQNYQQPMLTGYSVNSKYNNLNNPTTNNRAVYDNYALGDNSGYLDYGYNNGLLYNDINRQGSSYDDYNALGYNVNALGYDNNALGYTNNNFAALNSSPCSKNGLNPLLVLIILAGAGVGFYFVYNKVKDTSGNGRLKTNSIYENLDLIWKGLEDFENKIDKIASGTDNGDEDSWINQLYKNFKPEDDENDNYDNVDGLEPPMLDETWGTNDIDHNSTKKKTSLDEDFKQYVEDIYNEPMSCQAKMWRCATRVAEGGLDYFDRPEGITGVLKNYLFKIGFQGAFGKVWNAVMSIPEARKFKICMAASEKCKANEVLKNEANNDSANRFLVNPEYVQDLDQSDGSKQFDQPIDEFEA